MTDFYDRPDVAEWLTAPGLRRRLQDALAAGQITREQAQILHRDAQQVHRAASGHVSTNPEAWGMTERVEIPREQFHPDRGPGTPLYEAVSQLESDATARALQQRMGTDARRAEASTWERSDPHYRPPSQVDAERPPSLRESVEAAASLNYPQE